MSWFYTAAADSSIAVVGLGLRYSQPEGVTGDLTFPRRLALWLLPAYVIWSLASPLVAAGELRIETSESQRVTLDASSESLRAAVEQLCAKTGVELRGYDAADRSFSAQFNDEPLSRVLERLLRLEIYMVGVRSSDAPSRGRRSHKVNWLRVMGSQDSAAVLRQTLSQASQPIATPLGVDASVAATALADPDATKRNAAVQEIVRHMKENPATLDALLPTDLSGRVEELAGHEHAVKLLRAIQAETPDRGRSMKLEGLIRSLELRRRMNAKAQGAKPVWGAQRP